MAFVAHANIGSRLPHGFLCYLQVNASIESRVLTCYYTGFATESGRDYSGGGGVPRLVARHNANGWSRVKDLRAKNRGNVDNCLAS